MTRLAVLTSHPVQYSAPLFQTIAADPSFDLTVLYCSRLGVDPGLSMGNFGQHVVWDIDLLGGYRHKFLWNPVPAHPDRRLSMVNPEIVKELSRDRYDLVVNHGWAFPVDWLSFLVCRARGIPF